MSVGDTVRVEIKTLRDFNRVSMSYRNKGTLSSNLDVKVSARVRTSGGGWITVQLDAESGQRAGSWELPDNVAARHFVFEFISTGTLGEPVQLWAWIAAELCRGREDE